MGRGHARCPDGRERASVAKLKGPHVAGELNGLCIGLVIKCWTVRGSNCTPASTGVVSCSAPSCSATRSATPSASGTSLTAATAARVKGGMDRGDVHLPACKGGEAANTPNGVSNDSGCPTDPAQVIPNPPMRGGHKPVRLQITTHTHYTNTHTHKKQLSTPCVVHV